MFKCSHNIITEKKLQPLYSLGNVKSDHIKINRIGNLYLKSCVMKKVKEVLTNNKLKGFNSFGVLLCLNFNL